MSRPIALLLLLGLTMFVASESLASGEELSDAEVDLLDLDILIEEAENDLRESWTEDEDEWDEDDDDDNDDDYDDDDEYDGKIKLSVEDQRLSDLCSKTPDAVDCQVPCEASAHPCSDLYATAECKVMPCSDCPRGRKCVCFCSKP